MLRRQELYPSLCVIIVCLTGRSDNCGRCKEVRHSERATVCMNQPVRLISADRSHCFHQLMPTSATYTHTHTHTHARICRLTAPRRSISFFYAPLHSYIAACLPNTFCCLRGGNCSQFDWNLFVCSQVFISLALCFSNWSIKWKLF